MTLLNLPPYFELPQHPIGWIWAGFLVFVIALLLRHWFSYQKPIRGRLWGFFIVLVLLMPITSLSLGIRLPYLGALTLPNGFHQSTGYALMFGASLPWFLAAGFLGPLCAAIIAAASGLCIGLWDTHSLFTPLEITIVALCLSATLRQRYRTWEFQFLRSPLIAGVTASVAYPLFFSLNSFISSFTGFSTEELIKSFEYTLSHVPSASIAFGISMLLAAMITQVIATFFPQGWGQRETLNPSPSEQSIEVWFFYSLVPFLLILAALWIGGIWFLVSNNIQQMLLGRMKSAANIIEVGLPAYIHEGSQTIEKFSHDSRLYLTPLIPGNDATVPILPDEAALGKVLEDEILTTPFFQQMILINKHGAIVATYSLQVENGKPILFEDERVGVNVALNIPSMMKKELVRYYPIPSDEENGFIQVSFILPIEDEDKKLRGVLIGRSNITENMLFKPALTSLMSLQDVGGYGTLIDEKGRMLYHQNQRYLFQMHAQTDNEVKYSVIELDGVDGKKYISYSRAVAQTPWKVIFAVPSRYVQTNTIRIVLIFTLMLAGGALLTMFVMRQGLRKIIDSIHTFAAQTERISQGEFDTSNYPSIINIVGEENELGQLRRSFDKMRKRLKKRLEELNHLLIVGQKVASTLDMNEALIPILESALNNGASSARVVLKEINTNVNDKNSKQLFQSYGLGALSEAYAYLDAQLMDIMKEKDIIVLTNLSRASVFSFEPSPSGELIFPETLVALNLHHKENYYGVFWITYQQLRHFKEDDEEIRFLKTLASLAAMAASNTQLFRNAEFGRQRLVAILASTPDPVFVIDQENLLLFVNAAAVQALVDAKIPPNSLSNQPPRSGQVLDKTIRHEKLLELLLSPQDDIHSAEIRLPDNRIYIATVTSISTEYEKIGRVCVLQDVTYYKELDSLKSEFVSTVSHDLRSPLTVIQGYLSMLEVVGSLNEYQMDYVKKMTMSIEQMINLINELLDIERIEAGISLQLESVLVKELLERTVIPFQVQAAQKQIHITIKMINTQENIAILADYSLLQQALNNVLENAIKFTPMGGVVKIEVETKDSEIIFAIKDTGIGVAPLDQERLFEKFYRVVKYPFSTKQKETESESQNLSRQSSAGLGLTIVKSIIERHQGRVWVESRLGKGSTFYLAIPMTSSDLNKQPPIVFH